MIYELPFTVLPIDDVGYHIVIDAKINGKPVRLIVDTGASKTAFDLESLERLGEETELEANEELSAGLGTTSMQSYFLGIDLFELGDLKVEDYLAVALDLSNINVTYEQLGLEPIDGVLGGDLLMDYKAIVDYKKSCLKFFVDRRAKAI
jgi:hypothetical protein